MFEFYQVYVGTRYDVTSWILEEYFIYHQLTVNKHQLTVYSLVQYTKTALTHNSELLRPWSNVDQVHLH